MQTKATPLTERQKELLRRWGITPKDYFKHWFHYFNSGRSSNITKAGGYKVIPNSLISEVAKSVGLSEKDLPEIVISRCEYPGEIRSTGNGKYQVRIARRLHKSAVPSVLQHEFIHIKLEHFPLRAKTWEEWLTREFDASTLTNDNQSLFEYVVMLHSFGVSYRDSFRLVTKAARSYGMSKRKIRETTLFFKDYIEFCEPGAK